MADNAEVVRSINQYYGTDIENLMPDDSSTWASTGIFYDYEYVWTRVGTTYDDGTTLYTNPLLTNNYNKVVSVVAQYCSFSSEDDTPDDTTLWTENMPSGDGIFVWVRTKTEFQDGEIEYSSPERVNTGESDDESPAEDDSGDSAIPVVISSTTQYYGTDDKDEVPVESSAWSDVTPIGKTYLWVRTATTYDDGTISYSTPTLDISDDERSDEGNNLPPADPAIEGDYIEPESANPDEMSEEIEGLIFEEGEKDDPPESVVISDYVAMQQEIFDKLTGYGENEGIFYWDNVTDTDPDTGETVTKKQLFINASFIRTGILQLGGSNNKYGVLQILDTSNNIIGQWDKTGISLKDGNIRSADGKSYWNLADGTQKIGGDNAYVEWYDSNNDGTADSLRIVGANISIASGDSIDTAIKGAVTDAVQPIYSKLSGRNYLIATGTPIERALNSNATGSSLETQFLYGTYGLTPLSEFGFSVGDKVTLSYDWKQKLNNLLAYPYFSNGGTPAGVTYTDNGDGTVKANGTATANTRFYFRNTNDAFTLEAGATYKFSLGTALATTVGTGEVALYNGTTYTGTVFLTDGTGEKTFTVPSNVTFDRVTIYVAIKNGQTVSNLTFTPKLYRTDALGKFHAEAYRTDGNNIAYIARISDIITPTATVTSGHVETTTTLTAALLNMGCVFMRADNSKSSITISNMKLELGDTATPWSVAMEDAKIASPGANMIRGTNSITELNQTSTWATPGFRKTSYGGTSGTVTPISVSDASIPRIKVGWRDTCSVDTNAWSAYAGTCQYTVPNIKPRQAYTVSCYAKGTGFLHMIPFGVLSGLMSRIYLDNVTKWTRYSFTIIAPNNSNHLSLVNNTSNWGTGAANKGSDISVCGMKLEEGITATEWTEAQEDIDNKIDDARKVATNYVAIDSSGLMVADMTNGTQTPSTATSENVFIDSNSVNIRDGQDALASFGEEVTVGKIDGSHSYLKEDYHSLRLIDKEGKTYFHVSDLRDKNGNYIATDYFSGNGEKTEFPLSLEATTEDYEVTVTGVETFGITKTKKSIIFSSPPYRWNKITAVYSTTDAKAKAYTLGSRKSNNKIGGYSMAEGYDVVSSGFTSHAEGYGSVATGLGAHAEGVSLRFGRSSNEDDMPGFVDEFTTASGEGSHAEGMATTASGASSHAEGDMSTASGISSHAEGGSTTASGIYSHAEGMATTASGLASHAEGWGSNAYGEYSHANGYYTIAQGVAQTVIGRSNIADGSENSFSDADSAFIIGNGTPANRSNVFNVTWGGQTYLKGDAIFHLVRPSTGDTFVSCERTDTGNAIKYGIDSGGVNRGIWDAPLNKWIFHTNGTDVFVNNMNFGSAQKARAAIGLDYVYTYSGSGVNKSGTGTTYTDIYRAGSNSSMPAGTWLVGLTCSYTTSKNTSQARLVNGTTSLLEMTTNIQTGSSTNIGANNETKFGIFTNTSALNGAFGIQLKAQDSGTTWKSYAYSSLSFFAVKLK